MNLAKQHEATEPQESNRFQVNNESQPSNIIVLPGQTFSERSSSHSALLEEFADHQFSALNEW